MARIAWRNPQWNAAGQILVDIEHPEFGWIPYAADPNDPYDILLRDGSDQTLHEVILASDTPIAEPEPEPEPDPYPPLTRRQFAWMLDYYDLEGIWKGVHTDAKAAGNKALAANLRALEDSGEYYLDNTLFFISQVRDQPKVAASGIDLSDDAIRSYWRHASVQTFESLTEAVPHPDSPT